VPAWLLCLPVRRGWRLPEHHDEASYGRQVQAAEPRWALHPLGSLPLSSRGAATQASTAALEHDGRSVKSKVRSLLVDCGIATNTANCRTTYWLFMPVVLSRWCSGRRSCLGWGPKHLPSHSTPARVHAGCCVAPAHHRASPLRCPADQRHRRRRPRRRPASAAHRAAARAY
jgi:hypothetical protein